MTTIFATLDAQGQPVELLPGQNFTTFHLAEGGQTVDFEASHPWTALDAYGPDDLARYTIQTPAFPDPPAGQQLADYALTVTDGVIAVAATFQPIPPPPVPDEVSAMQAQLVLDQTGRLDAVEAAIAQASRQVQIYWAKATTLHRQHPVLLQMAQALGMTSDDLDALFVAAAALS